MRKLSAHSSIGLLLIAVSFAAGHVMPFPAFLSGLLLGLGLCLMLFGLYKNGQAIGKVRAFKRRLLHLGVK